MLTISAIRTQDRRIVSLRSSWTIQQDPILNKTKLNSVAEEAFANQ